MNLLKWSSDKRELPKWILDNFDLNRIELLETAQEWLVIEGNGDGTATIIREENGDLIKYANCFPVTLREFSSKHS